MQVNITSLREELFKTMKRLNSGSDPADIARAKAVAQIGQVLTDTARVEIDYMNATKKQFISDFLNVQQDEVITEEKQIPSGVVQVTRHISK